MTRPTDQAQMLLLSLTGIFGAKNAVAEKLGLSPQTFQRRLDCPEEITIGELTKAMETARRRGVSWNILFTTEINR